MGQLGCRGLQRGAGAVRQLNVDVRPLAHIRFGIKGQGFEAGNIPDRRSPGVHKFQAANLALIRRDERDLYAHQVTSSRVRSFRLRRSERRQGRADQGIRAPEDVRPAVFLNRCRSGSEQLMPYPPGRLQRHPKRQRRLSGNHIGIDTRNKAERNIAPADQTTRQNQQRDPRGQRRVAMGQGKP